MTLQPYRRTQYLVDRGYQLSFVSRVFLVILAVAVFSFSMATVLLAKHLYAPESHTPLVVALVAITTMMLIELLISIPLVFLLSVRQSHRIMGPMSRIQRALEAIGTGDFTQRVVIRQGDALEDLAKTINRMAEELQHRFPKPPG